MSIKTLSKSQISFFEREGYLVVEGFLSHEKCDYFHSLAKKHADQEHAVMMNVHKRIEEFYHLIKDPGIICILNTLQKGAVIGLSGHYIFKEPKTRYARDTWYPHQDNSYPRGRKGAYITTNIFLDDTDKENGTVYVYPRSHQEDLLSFEHVKSYVGEPDSDGLIHSGQRVEVPPHYERVDLTMGKGALLILHGHLIHGSYPNLSSHRPRPTFAFGYMTVGDAFVEGNSAKREVINLEN